MKSLFIKLTPVVWSAVLALAMSAAEPSPAERSSALTEARAQLEQLKHKYTDSHPLVIELKAKIAALETQPAADPSMATTPTSVPWRPVSIDFRGGSVADFLAAFSKIEGVSLSIVSTDEGDGDGLSIQLPSFVLRNTSVVTIVNVLSRLLLPRGYDLSEQSSDPNSVVAVLSRKPTRRPTTNPPRIAPVTFDSFPVGAYLAEQSIDDIVGAIRAGWELDPAHDAGALRLKFHPATSILLVSGPPEAMMVATKVISQLKGPFDKDSKSNLPSAKPVRETPPR